MQATTVERAIDLLFQLHASAEPVALSSLSRSSGMPKTNVHRLLASLASRGLVERDERGRYRPGMALVTLGLSALRSEPVVELARPLLEAAAQAVGETFFLVASRAGSLRVLLKAEGTSFLRAAPAVGSEVPLHATAVGKIHLAFGATLPLPSDPLEPFTPVTPADSRALADEVARVARAGFAVSRDEWQRGLSVAAAPVLAGSRLAAAVAVGAASPRFDSLGEANLVDRVLEVARELAQRIEPTS